MHLLLEDYKPLAGVRANFVVDAKGRHTNVDGNSRGIGGQLDFDLLIHLRSISDLIVTDAATARAEGYRPSKYAPIAVLSPSGDFAGIHVAGADFLQLAAPITAKLLAELTEQFGAGILLEFGPSALQEAIQQGLVDELCLTVASEVPLSEIQLPFRTSDLDLVSIRAEAGSQFTVWRRASGAEIH